MMDLNSILRRFIYRDSSATGDIFVIDDDLRNEKRDRGERNGDLSDFDEHMHIFHEMRETFNSVFLSPLEMMIGFPKFDDHYPKSPRSIMLKDNEEPTDSFSLKKNLKKNQCPYQEKEENTKTSCFTYATFSSIKTVHLPNGTVEEHRTVIKNDGNKVTTISRSIGDISHEVITKSDRQGITEKEENFMNLDESELTNFEQKWNKLRSGDLIEPHVPSVSLPTSSPSYWYLLKKFFGSSQKDEIKWC